jgi:hypothetical protein
VVIPPAEAFLAPDFPAERLAGAAKVYGTALSGGNLLAMIDESWEGSGERGFLFLTDGYYFTAGRNAVFQSYREEVQFTSGAGYHLPALNRLLTRLRALSDEETGGSTDLSAYQQREGGSLALVAAKLAQELTKCQEKLHQALLADGVAALRESLQAVLRLSCLLEPSLMAPQGMTESERESLTELGSSLQAAWERFPAAKRAKKSCRGCASNLNRACKTVVQSVELPLLRKTARLCQEQLAALQAVLLEINQ